MIDARDLRIGNYIIHNTYPKKINKGFFTELDENTTYNSNFYYLQINETWLNLFGFNLYDKMGENLFFAFNNNNTMDINILLNENQCLFSFYRLDWDRAIKIKYIHELQNLYKALTNEELELK